MRRALLEPHHDASRVVDGLVVVNTLYDLVDTFFLATRLSLIVELSFRRGLDEQRLQPLFARARVVNVHCSLA